MFKPQTKRRADEIVPLLRGTSVDVVVTVINSIFLTAMQAHSRAYSVSDVKWFVL